MTSSPRQGPRHKITVARGEISKVFADKNARTQRESRHHRIPTEPTTTTA
jgi:hypothetical protein